MILNLIHYLDVLMNCLYKKIKEHKLIEPKKEEERNIKKKMRKQLVAEASLLKLCVFFRSWLVIACTH